MDTFLTVEQSNGLADAIAASGKTLKAIYVTHAHGDHFFGLKVLQDRFPDAKALATPEVVAKMKLQITPEKLNGRWRKLFPNQISDVISIADPLQGNEIDLEGNKLVVVRLGHTDTDDLTCLHVPSIGLVVAGDAVYNGIHPFLIEFEPADPAGMDCRARQDRRPETVSGCRGTQEFPPTMTARKTWKRRASISATSFG